MYDPGLFLVGILGGMILLPVTLCIRLYLLGLPQLRGVPLGQVACLLKVTRLFVCGLVLLLVLSLLDRYVGVSSGLLIGMILSMLPLFIWRSGSLSLLHRVSCLEQGGMIVHFRVAQVMRGSYDRLLLGLEPANLPAGWGELVWVRLTGVRLPMAVSGYASGHASEQDVVVISRILQVMEPWFFWLSSDHRLNRLGQLAIAPVNTGGARQLSGSMRTSVGQPMEARLLVSVSSGRSEVAYVDLTPLLMRADHVQHERQRIASRVR